ncbi:MAG TPA: hypothetical protein VFC69_02005 [Dysgonamonadaceae bacterium]|nr:hypothetical protein [Dysgonamonadaceae bacterium]
MARKKLTPMQMGFIALLWIFLVAFIIIYSPEITFTTVISIIMSGIIVFIPIYKSFKK